MINITYAQKGRSQMGEPTVAQDTRNHSRRCLTLIAAVGVVGSSTGGYGAEEQTKIQTVVRWPTATLRLPSLLTLSDCA
jgi:hypothetical protein